MKAVNFDEANVKIAEHQDEYETLPAHYSRQGNLTGAVTVCFELDEEEKKQVAETGRIYLGILTFGKPLHPIKGSIINPFKKEEI